MIEVTLKVAIRAASSNDTSRVVEIQIEVARQIANMNVTKPRTCSSNQIADGSPRSVRMNTTNGSDPRIMKAMQVHCSAASGKKPKLLSWVENPAVATVVRAWQIASNGDMPKAR